MISYQQLFRQLDEVGTLSRGKSKHRPRNDPALYGGAHPFIQTGDVKHSNFYVTSYSQTYSDKGLRQSKMWPSGTLCITIAANIADTAILSFPACFPDSIIGFTSKDGVASTAFIKYCLDTYKTQMRSISQGTTQDNLSQGKLLSLKFRIPDFETQKKIAAILSAYDDLIANNQRRITLLERMAEDIYREWFVRLRFPGHEQAKMEKGLPPGWRLVELSEIASVNNTSLKKGKEPERILYIDISAVATNQIIEMTEMALVDAPGRARRLVKHGDVIWSSVRPGNRAYCLVYAPPKNVVASTGFAVISPKPDMPFTFVNFAVTSDSFVEQMTTVAKGSAYPATSFDDFGKAKILLPSLELLRRFHTLCEPMFAQRHQLSQANSVLTKNRNALLPRLISGKLAVDALDIRFPSDF
jgi:type I restriction enzyme, S subunit